MDLDILIDAASALSLRPRRPRQRCQWKAGASLVQALIVVGE